MIAAFGWGLLAGSSFLVGGAMAGNAIENASTRRAGLEITVRLDSGDVRVITQEADVPISTGQRVQVVTQGGVSRVGGI